MCQQGSKFPVGASFAENVSDLIEVVWQEFAHKIQYQRFAETELSFVGDRDVILFILDVIGQLIVEPVQVGELGTPIDGARPPAEDGLMLADAASDEFEREEYVLKADGHRSACKKVTAAVRPPFLGSAGSALLPKCQDAHANAGSFPPTVRVFCSEPRRCACGCQ